jgi:hypothetical protein
MSPTIGIRVLVAWTGAQQLERLVEQRHVVVGEDDLGGVVVAGPGEQRPLVVAEVA